MLFCPTCANLLVISAESGLNKWACNSCPYEFPITKQVCAGKLQCYWKSTSSCSSDDFTDAPKTKGNRRCIGRRRDVGPCRSNTRCVVFSIPLMACSEDTQRVASCDKCNHNSAYFYQLQIRSADEPMTTCTCIAISCEYSY